ncbi:MAG: DMT family transporter [Gammaproteobacteria bacterium]|nr:DMT family transporter [Gammaproteobacteria bacterium]
MIRSADDPAERRHSPLVGVAWMLLGTLMGSGIDACVKALQGGFDTPQIVLLRLLCALPFVLLFARFMGGFARIRPKRWRWHIFRACCASGATFSFFWALGELPLVLIVTIGFAAPLLVALLSRPFLGERVGAMRWLGIVVGFAGVLVAVQPASGAAPLSWDPAILAVLGATLCWALLVMSARRMGTDEPAGAMVLFTMPLSIVIGGVLSIGNWVTPTAGDWALFAALGLFGASVHYCAVFAYRASRATTVAPIEYTALIWSALLGYAFFDEIPGEWTLAGAVIIVAGGLLAMRARD